MPPTSQTSPDRPALRELAEDHHSRKRFLRMVGGGGASALALLLAACGDDNNDSGSSTGAATQDQTTTQGSTQSSATSAKGDIDIVNYALTLEYLEADFYKQVVDSGAIKDKKTVELAKQFGETEQQHVEALKAAVGKLGGTAVTAPKTNFGDVLSGGAKKILATAATVENLGAAAYLGQAGKIANPEILAAALSIHSVEARHAAALNQLIGAGFTGKDALTGSLPDGAFAKPMDMDAVLAAAKPFIAS